MLLQSQWHQITTPTPTCCAVTPLPTLVITLPGDVPLEMVRIPAGRFQMGSDDGPDWSWCHEDNNCTYCTNCEQPVHTVNIGYDFYMGKYEVTQAQWTAVLRANPAHFRGADLPVEMIDGSQAREFLRRIQSRFAVRGLVLRLPSEAEWEYAARAGTRTLFASGDSELDLARSAWYRQNSRGRTRPAGGRAPNAWGLHDMHGNVAEWCEDVWHETYAGAPADGRARVEGGDGDKRVQRGGSWGCLPLNCRSARRYGAPWTERNKYVGFRIVLEVWPEYPGWEKK